MKTPRVLLLGLLIMLVISGCVQHKPVVHYPTLTPQPTNTPEPTPLPSPTPYVVTEEDKYPAVMGYEPNRDGDGWDEEEWMSTLVSAKRFSEMIYIKCDDFIEENLADIENAGFKAGVYVDPVYQDIMSPLKCLSKAVKNKAVVELGFGLWGPQIDPKRDEFIQAVLDFADGADRKSFVFATSDELYIYGIKPEDVDTIVVIPAWEGLFDYSYEYRLAVNFIARNWPNALIGPAVFSFDDNTFNLTGESNKNMFAMSVSVNEEYGFATVPGMGLLGGDPPGALTYDPSDYPDAWPIPGPIDGEGTPEIQLDPIPKIGEPYKTISGKVSHVIAPYFRLFVYVKVDGSWWPKPYYGEESQKIAPDGSFEIKTVTGGNDYLATEVVVYLVPAGDTIENAVAKITVVRETK